MPNFVAGVVTRSYIWQSPRIGQVENPEDADWRTWPLPPHMERALRDLRRNLSTIQYLGPLRAAAKRYYTAQVDPDTLLDPAGERLPYLLRDRGEMLVWNWRMHGEDSRKEKLTSALNYWLYYIRTGKTRNQYDECFGELSLENTQELLIQLAVRSADRYGDIPTIGLRVRIFATIANSRKGADHKSWKHFHN